MEEAASGVTGIMVQGVRGAKIHIMGPIYGKSITELQEILACMKRPRSYRVLHLQMNKITIIEPKRTVTAPLVPRS
jgi:hypothetical protein